MTSIGTLANQTLVLQSIKRMQEQAADLQSQVNTGLKSQDYSGLAGSAGQLANLQAAVKNHQAYLDTITTIETRVQEQSSVLSSINKIVSQMREQLPNGAYNNNIQSLAKQSLAAIGDLLNSQDGSRYLFSGSLTSTAPYDQTGLPNPGTLTNPVNGPPPNGYYAGNDAIASVKIDTNLTLQYGITANDPAFENVIRALNFLANLPAGAPDPTNPTDVANVSTAANLVESSLTSLQGLQTSLSQQQAELTTTQTQHQNIINLTQTSIQNLESADPATAITQLNHLETALQASYSTISGLSSISLVNYLKF